MALAFRKFSRLEHATSFLQGHLVGSVSLLRNGNSLYLHGKTLIFTTPSATVTFDATPDGTQIPLTLAQVKSQIEAGASGVTCHFSEGRLDLFMATPGSIALDKDGTANAQLGFSTTADSSAAVYAAPGGSAPALVQIVPDTGSNSFVVVTDDA
jgi:hypothetical protein